MEADNIDGKKEPKRLPVWACISLFIVVLFIFIGLYGTLVSGGLSLVLGVEARHPGVVGYIFVEASMLLAVLTAAVILLRLERRPFSDLGLSLKGHASGLWYGLLMAILLYLLGFGISVVLGEIEVTGFQFKPLAELVKIDPKSIGVGQYQHDVDQTKLKKALDQTVENCVNLVGVNLNTASSHLLTYISGLGPQLAQNIVNYRAENGAFGSRKELMKVPRMGAKAFEQCAGFLRIPGAKNPLDNTAVHPESYHIVEQMAKDLKCTIDELIADKELRRKINISAYITPTVGLPTLQDILQELDKPGRDPRKAIKVFEFDKNVRTIADLREGMILPGIVGNITNFGAFVDIGIKENGLVHLSQLAERFISDPTEVVSIHQHVMVRVMNVDYDRKRIQLSMIGVQQD
jgi:protein Tex